MYTNNVGVFFFKVINDGLVWTFLVLTSLADVIEMMNC